MARAAHAEVEQLPGLSHGLAGSWQSPGAPLPCPSPLASPSPHRVSPVPGTVLGGWGSPGLLWQCQGDSSAHPLLTKLRLSPRQTGAPAPDTANAAFNGIVA